MFSKYLKSVLAFNRAQNGAPHFVLVYLLIWLAWHNQFFITFFASASGFSNQLSSALSATSHQYVIVLFLTLLFYTIRLLYLYFVHKTDDFIDEDEPIESKVRNDQVFKENKDVVRLLELLEDTKIQLSKVKEREAQAKIDKTSAISKMLAVQTELDMALADIDILVKSNEELKSKLNEHKAA